MYSHSTDLVCTMQTFCDAKKKDIRAANPQAGFAQMNQLLEAAWGKCSPEEKAYFNRKQR